MAFEIKIITIYSHSFAKYCQNDMNIDKAQFFGSDKDFNPDLSDRKVVIKSYSEFQKEEWYPWHSHKKHQLILLLRGAMSLVVENSVWMIPPKSALWIPAESNHITRVAEKACLHSVYLAPDMPELPGHCCMLAITPLVRELIHHLASLDQLSQPDQATEQIMAVLIQQLALMPVERFHFPLPGDHRLEKVVSILMDNPEDRRTVDQWAKLAGMSERTLTRIILQETGMTFGLWRQQLQLTKALHLLSSGASVQSTAENLGYESVSAFIGMFKKNLGKSPRQYVLSQLREPVGLKHP